MMEHGQLPTKPPKKKDELKWTKHFLDTNKSTTPSTANTFSTTLSLLRQSLALVQGASPAGFIAKRVARFLLWEKPKPLLAEVGVHAGAKDAVPAKDAVAAASPIPVIAIGGINCDNVSTLSTGGAQGFAFISEIANSPNPVDTTKQLIAKFSSRVK